MSKHHPQAYLLLYQPSIRKGAACFQSLHSGSLSRSPNWTNALRPAASFQSKLDEIVALAESHDAMVFVDDSHATGFIGKTGRGTPEHFGVLGKVDLITTTFGKALGGAREGASRPRHRGLPEGREETRDSRQDQERDRGEIRPLTGETGEAKMLAKRILEVPVPAGVDITGADQELLKATFQALVALRCDKAHCWGERVEELRKEGWTVQWGLTWRAEAKRGEEYEEATGATLDEAMAGVDQLVRLDMVGHAP